MYKDKLKIILIDIIMPIAIFFGLYYICTTHFSFMLSLFHFRMHNVSSISYTLMRFLYGLMPLLIFVPSISHSKCTRIKLIFYLLGIFYILGSSWIIYYLIDNPISMLQDLAKTTEYLQVNALNFDYLVWDSFDLFGILFSMVTAALYFLIAYNIDKNTRLAVILYWVVTALSLLLPMIYTLLIPGSPFLSAMWLQKNLIPIISGIMVGVALTIAESSERVWYAFIL